MCFNSVLGIQMKGRQRGYYLLSQIKFFANVQEFYGVKTGRACGAAAVSPTPGGKIPWRREWQPTPVFLPGESHGERSMALSQELDTT